MSEENRNNVLPSLKIGQCVSYLYETEMSGVKLSGILKGIIVEISIEKEQPHQKYLSPTIYYKIQTKSDPDCFITKSEKFLLKEKELRITQGCAIDPFVEEPVYAKEEIARLNQMLLDMRCCQNCQEIVRQKMAGTVSVISHKPCVECNGYSNWKFRKVEMR